MDTYKQPWFNISAKVSRSEVTGGSTTLVRWRNETVWICPTCRRAYFSCDEETAGFLVGCSPIEVIGPLVETYGLKNGPPLEQDVPPLHADCKYCGSQPDL